MMTSVRLLKTGIVACALGLTVACASVAAAQGPDGGPPGGGFPAGGPPLGMRGPGEFGGRVTAATLPTALLKKSLGLSDDQVATIAGIQKKFRQESAALRPARPDANGGPPDAANMKEAMARIKSLQDSADKDIRSALSATQQEALTKFVQSADDAAAVGIPVAALADLKLTADQRKQIGAIAAKARKADAAARAQVEQSGDRDTAMQAARAARREASTAARILLTDDQKAVLRKYRTARTAGAGRGGDGPGGPPPDGGGGPGGGPGGDGPGGPPPNGGGGQGGGMPGE